MVAKQPHILEPQRIDFQRSNSQIFLQMESEDLSGWAYTQADMSKLGTHVILFVLVSSSYLKYR